MENPDREWHDLLFDIRRSIRYHHRRRAFFERLDQFANMMALIFGSATVFGVLTQEYRGLALASAATVTILSSINLVLGSSQKARAHSDFARQFIELEKRMVTASADESLLRDVANARLTIETEEPPILRVLDVICRNELMRAMGYPQANLVKVRWWQRAFADVVDLRDDLIQA